MLYNFFFGIHHEIKIKCIELPDGKHEHRYPYIAVSGSIEVWCRQQGATVHASIATCCEQWNAFART